MDLNIWDCKSVCRMIPFICLLDYSDFLDSVLMILDSAGDDVEHAEVPSGNQASVREKAPCRFCCTSQGQCCFLRCVIWIQDCLSMGHHSRAVSPTALSPASKQALMQERNNFRFFVLCIKLRLPRTRKSLVNPLPNVWR
jgi:hypothetical protein